MLIRIYEVATHPEGDTPRMESLARDVNLRSNLNSMPKWGRGEQWGSQNKGEDGGKARDKEKMQIYCAFIHSGMRSIKICPNNPTPQVHGGRL